MDGYDIENCLESMTILVDTREQPSRRATSRLESMGCPFVRRTLDYGDYTYDCVLPNGKNLRGTETVKSDVVIERKMDLAELSGCFTGKKDAESKALGVRNRFEREFLRAKMHDATIYLIVEDATWENLYNGKYKTKFKPQAFVASLFAWMARYDIKVIFCKQETSGKIIKEILYRELKEHLERGDYDGLCED